MMRRMLPAMMCIMLGTESALGFANKPVVAILANWRAEEQ
jgi:hypothetical protein